MSWNIIDKEGAKAISEALKQNHIIANIDLSDNIIDKEGAIAISEALKCNHTITYINIQQRW